MHMFCSRLNALIKLVFKYMPDSFIIIYSFSLSRTVLYQAVCLTTYLGTVRTMDPNECYLRKAGETTELS